MSSIKHTVYGLFRQFSSNTIQLSGTTPSSDLSDALIIDNFQKGQSSTEKTPSMQTSMYESLPRNRRKKSSTGENNLPLKPPPYPTSSSTTNNGHRNRRSSGKNIVLTHSSSSVQNGKPEKSDHHNANNMRNRKNRPNSLDTSGSAHHENKSFIANYLSGKCSSRQHPEIYYGKTGVDLPVFKIEPLQSRIVSAYTGPDGGLTKVPALSEKRPMANLANLDDELSLSLEAESILNGGGTDSMFMTTKNGGPSSELNNAASSLQRSNSVDYNRVDLSPLSSINNLTEAYCNNRDICSGTGNGKTNLQRQISSDGSSKSVGQTYACSESIDWYSSSDHAYGMSISLYERNPFTRVHAGNPIADVFAIISRENFCILALADGVNWGEKARLAARCAVRGAVDYLNCHLFKHSGPDRVPVSTTHDIFHYLLRSFHAGHQLIVQEGGALTTLCVVVLCPLKDAQDQWVACACNVGDSLAFVYNRQHGVREITLGSHDIQQMRDMRDAGGALGPVDGVNPELHNMTCSMTVVDSGDLVFVTSDGVSDNFDPIVGKFCAPPSPQPPAQAQQTPHSARETNAMTSGEKRENLKNLPSVEAYQRHELMLLRLEDMLSNGVTLGDPPVNSAKDLCKNLINFVIQLTTAKRKTLEDPELYTNDLTSINNRTFNAEKSASAIRNEQKRRRHAVRAKIAEMPGKLDHASVVAFQVPLLWKHREILMSDDAKNGFEEKNDNNMDETWSFDLACEDKLNLKKRCSMPENASASSAIINYTEKPFSSENGEFRQVCLNNAHNNESSPNPLKQCSSISKLPIASPRGDETGSKNGNGLRRLSRTLEKIVLGVRRTNTNKKHGRHSPTRHTVAVQPSELPSSLMKPAGAPAQTSNTPMPERRPPIWTCASSRKVAAPPLLKNRNATAPNIEEMGGGYVETPVVTIQDIYTTTEAIFKKASQHEQTSINQQQQVSLSIKFCLESLV